MKITMPGNIFYKQKRVGKNGKLFYVYKFRSMVQDAEEKTGHTLSWEGDLRVTNLGSFLRRSHLDELPQLLNVVKGDMYFVGPRPERSEFTSVYDLTIEGYTNRNNVKPGITGLAQIVCPYDATAEQKLKFDLMCIALRHSFILNGLIVYHTILKMVLLKTTSDLVRTRVH